MCKVAARAASRPFVRVSVSPAVTCKEKDELPAGRHHAALTLPPEPIVNVASAGVNLTDYEIRCQSRSSAHVAAQNTGKTGRRALHSLCMVLFTIATKWDYFVTSPP